MQACQVGLAVILARFSSICCSALLCLITHLLLQGMCSKASIDFGGLQPGWSRFVRQGRSGLWYLSTVALVNEQAGLDTPSKSHHLKLLPTTGNSLQTISGDLWLPHVYDTRSLADKSYSK